MTYVTISFAEFTALGRTRSFASLRMTRAGLRVTGEGLRVTKKNFLRTLL
jgi:hypothetical protein